MADDLMPDEGAFLSFLNWLDRPGQVVRNLLTGRPGAAGRQALDFLGEIPDAILPGNLIPDATTKSDYVAPHELVGMDEDTPWYARVPTDLALGIATDPLSLIGVGEVAGATRAGLKLGVPMVKSLQKTIDVGHDLDPIRGIGRAYDALAPQGLQDALSPAARAVRATFGAQNLTPEAEGIAAAARAAQGNVSRAGLANVEQIISGLSPDESRQAFDLASNLRFGDDGRSVSHIVPPATDDLLEPIDSQISRLRERAPDFLGVDPAALDAHPVYRAAEEALRHGQRQFDEGLDLGIFNRPPDLAPTASPRDYLQRSYTGVPQDDLDNLALGSPSAIKARSLTTPEDITSYLAENPGVGLERDLGKSLANRAEQQGRLAQKATIGRALSGPDFDLVSDGAKAKVAEALAKMPPEDAQVIGDLFNGLPARSAPMEMLAKVTRPWKGAVVYGLAVPKIGSLFRNRLSGAPMVAATPGAEAALGAMANPVNVAKDVIGAVMDGVGLGGKGKVFDDIRTIDQAFKDSGGVAKNAEAALRSAGRDDLAEAMKHGVLDSFVSSEKLLTDISKTGWKKWVGTILDSPAKMFQSTEHAMRLQTFQKILDSGKSPEEAAKLTRSALYDYAPSSAFNRTARDIIPFFQFQAKALPQQAKWIARNPAVGVASAQVFGQNQDEAIYPYLAEHAGFSLGHTPDGKLSYVGGFGLPEETLSLIPDFGGGIRGFGRDIERNVVANTQPLLKSTYEAISGRDPYFATDAFDYDNIPLIGHAGAAGRFYQGLVNSGVAPLAGAAALLKQSEDVSKGVTGEHDLGTTALDLLTGANVVDVDQTRALQQILENELASNPDVHKHISLYQTSDDPETKALLQQYRQAQAKLKAERDKAKAGGVL